MPAAALLEHVQVSRHDASPAAAAHQNAPPTVTPRPTAASTRVIVRSSAGSAANGYGTVRFLSPQDPDLQIVVETVRVKTLDPEQYPADSGAQWYAGMHLRVTNTGQKPYVGSVDGRFALSDDEGKVDTHPMAEDSASAWLPDVLSDLSLAPGETSSGCVYFELDKSQSPVGFEFSSAGFLETGRWPVI